MSNRFQIVLQIIIKNTKCINNMKKANKNYKYTKNIIKKLGFIRFKNEINKNLFFKYICQNINTYSLIEIIYHN